MDTSIARRMKWSMDPFVAVAYFAPEVNEEFEKLGLPMFPTGYAMARAWAFGRTSPQLIQATFFNFEPATITEGLPEAWDKAPPEEVGAARDRGVVRALARMTEGVELPDLAGMLDRFRRAVAACRPEGRPLFAAVAGAPWPDEDPVLAVWHGANRLREYRGDGHVAVLTAEGLDAVEVLVLHAGTGDVPKSALLATRRWSEEEWSAACSRLAERGFVGGDELTDEGRRFRDSIEERTDVLAMDPWEALGDEVQQLRTEVRVFTKAVVDAGGVAGRMGKRALDEG